MYAFKIIVTTLIFLMMILDLFAALKGNKATKTCAGIWLVLEGLSIIAIWG